MFLAAVLGASGAYVYAGAVRPWDFATYYYAAQALRAGQDPYSLEALTALGVEAVELPFRYPPIALAVFLPFTTFPLHVAAALWLGIKVLLLGVTLHLWRMEFLSGVSLRKLIPITLLGFNLAVLWDLRTGNVALVEAGLFWSAFAWYRRSKTWITGYLIAIGSVFKLLGAALLALLLMRRGPGGRRGTVVLACLVVLLATVSVPAGLASQWRAALFGGIDERPTGDINPSALGVADWIASAFELPGSVAPYVGICMYLMFALAVIVLSAGPLLRVQANGTATEHVVAAVLLWLLLSPRLMVYTYVMAIVPFLYIVETRLVSHAARCCAMALVTIQGIIRLMPGQPPDVLAPMSFAVLVGTWILWLVTPPRFEDQVAT